MKYLRALREAKGISTKEFAENLNVTTQAVGKWERGESMPQAALLPEIAKQLGCTIDALFGRDSANTA